MAGLFAILFLLALIITLVLFLSARKQRAQTGLPYGARIIYADTGAWKKVERPLFARRYGLTGKPDYIVAERGAANIATKTLGRGYTRNTRIKTKRSAFVCVHPRPEFFRHCDCLRAIS